MTACLYYRRGKDYENKWQWKQVFKEQYLDLGCWPLFGAPASSPQQQESKFLSALSSEPRSICGMERGVSQHGCATPKSTYRRLWCTQRVSALSLTHHRHVSLSRFMHPIRLSAQREPYGLSSHSCSRTKMFPSCICRQKAADLGQTSLHLCYLQVNLQ